MVRLPFLGADGAEEKEEDLQQGSPMTGTERGAHWDGKTMREII